MAEPKTKIPHGEPFTGPRGGSNGSRNFQRTSGKKGTGAQKLKRKRKR